MPSWRSGRQSNRRRCRPRHRSQARCSTLTAQSPQQQLLLIQPSHGWISLQLRPVWRYRELLYFLVWRDIKVRYKQTLLGMLWIVLQPVVSVLVFSLLFGQLLKVPSGGVPYPVFSYAALLPWNYFANSLTRSSTRLVESSHLITKVYFPRLIIPISGVLSGLVDFSIALLVLAALMLYYGIPPTPAVAFVPAFLAQATLTALGFGLWLSALNVRFRDITHAMPFLVQIWMYVTPVLYGSTLLPERFRVVLGLNPMAGVVEGFRWALLGERVPDGQLSAPVIALSIAVTTLVLITGAIFFRYTERTFADVI
jgi:homopolymeric O-antigen transport system permease protein